MTGDAWMRPVLDALIEQVDEVASRRALVDPASFDEVRARLDAAAAGLIPDGDRGDNLLMALLALRVKFGPDEARAKLETNLAMRRTSAPTMSGRP